MTGPQGKRHFFDILRSKHSFQQRAGLEVSESGGCVRFPLRPLPIPPPCLSCDVENEETPEGAQLVWEYRHLGVLRASTVPARNLWLASTLGSQDSIWMISLDLARFCSHAFDVSYAQIH